MCHVAHGGSTIGGGGVVGNSVPPPCCGLIFTVSGDGVNGFHMIGINWRLTFDAARAECESRDAQLASALSDDQTTFIGQYLTMSIFCPVPG